jgi:hypothetical protein
LTLAAIVAIGAIPKAKPLQDNGDGSFTTGLAQPRTLIHTRQQEPGSGDVKLL